MYCRKFSRGPIFKVFVYNRLITKFNFTNKYNRTVYMCVYENFKDWPSMKIGLLGKRAGGSMYARRGI